MTFSSKILIRVLRVGVSLLLLAIVYRRVDPQELRSLLVSARWELLFLALGLLYLNTALSAFKWRLFLVADGIRIPYFKLLNSYLIGSFMNLFLPSNIGGDAYRIIDISKRSRRTVGTFASVLADRLTGLCALAVLGLFFGLVSIRAIEEKEILLIPLAAMMSLIALMVALLQQRLLRLLLSRGPLRRMPRVTDFAEKLIESIAQYRRTPRLLPRALAVSFLFQFTAIVSIFVLSRALNLSIPFHYICAFIPLISVIEAIPISIYGLGIRDASYAFFFTGVGVARVDALALALAYVILTLVYSLFGGMLLLWRGIKSPMPEPLTSTEQHLPVVGKADARQDEFLKP